MYYELYPGLVDNLTVEEALWPILCYQEEDKIYTVKRVPVGVDTERQVILSFYENHYGEKGVCVECDGAVDYIRVNPKGELFENINTAELVKRVAEKINLDYFNVLPE